MYKGEFETQHECYVQQKLTGIFVLQEWLVHHSECPMCRETFLLADDIGIEENTIDAMFELVEHRNTRSRLTYCCAREGLVDIPPSNLDFTTEDLEVVLAKVKCTIDPEKLAKLRGGHRQQESESNNGHEMGSVDLSLEQIINTLETRDIEEAGGGLEPLHIVDDSQNASQYERSMSIEEEGTDGEHRIAAFETHVIEDAGGGLNAPRILDDSDNVPQPVEIERSMSTEEELADEQGIYTIQMHDLEETGGGLNALQILDDRDRSMSCDEALAKSEDGSVDCIYFAENTSSEIDDDSVAVDFAETSVPGDLKQSAWMWSSS
jgi:hypothetical protein